MQKQYELLIQQLDAAKVETRTIREQSEKYRSEILLIKMQSESGSASIRFELDSAKKEIIRLNQMLETITIELEKIKKENAQVIRPNTDQIISKYIIHFKIMQMQD